MKTPTLQRAMSEPVLSGKTRRQQKKQTAEESPSFGQLRKRCTAKRRSSLEGYEKTLLNIAEPLSIEKPVGDILASIYPLRDPEEEVQIDKARAQWYKGVQRIQTLRRLSAGYNPVGTGKKRRSTLDQNEKWLKYFDEQKAAGVPAAQLHKLQLAEFRKRVLARYRNVQEAFDSFDVNGDRELDLNEWVAALVRTGIGSPQEGHDLFPIIDPDKSGRISSKELHAALDWVTPVRSIEDLRKRLLNRFNSIKDALAALDGHATAKDSLLGHNTSLTFAEFRKCLARVYVDDPVDQEALFKLCLNPFEVSRKASLGDLQAALSAVSPVLMLEDLRDRFFTKYDSLADGFGAIDLDKGGELDHYEFTKGLIRIGIGRVDAERIFRLLDVDKSENICKTEMVSALQLSSPSIIFEDFRRQLRSRFNSIKEVFEAKLDERRERDLFAQLEFTPGEFQDIMADLDIGRRESKRLFDLIDADQNGLLSMMEILRGVRIFAPACVLQGIRHDLQLAHGEIHEAFKDVVSPNTMLNLEALEKLLERKGVNRKDDVQAMFDILILRSEQGISVNQLIAALQAAQSGFF